MTADEIESLERATLAAVPPQELVELDGWLLGIDDGTVGRAHSAVPLNPGAAASVAAVEGQYAQRGLRATFRVSQEQGFDPVRAALASRGYAPTQRTLTMTGRVADVAALASDVQVDLALQPAEEWGAVFLGPGFDPVDGASRLAILGRARQSIFASARKSGEVVAVGSACFAHGWCGLHAMRTVPAWRGKGLASSLLSAMAREAGARGLTRAFLQVEQANAAAQKLYRRAGFGTAWCYEYWRRG